MNNLKKLLTKKYFHNNNFYNLSLFDVSLRDGLQSQSKCYTFKEKKLLLHNIIQKYNPDSIEVGSIVSSKVLPQMNDSIELYKYAESLKNDIKYYLLIPNKNKLKIGIDNNVKHMSFISSFTDSFQKKNINKSLKDTKEELLEIDKILVNNNLLENKLYLSCFNHCPIEGYLYDESIIYELLFYNKLKAFNEFCLSDTTGKLDNETFEKIIIDIKKIINVNKLSLHLHYNKDNINNTILIIEEAFKNDISKLDVSCLEEGGCSVTINKNNLNSNITYNLLNKLIN